MLRQQRPQHPSSEDNELVSGLRTEVDRYRVEVDRLEKEVRELLPVSAPRRLLVPLSESITHSIAIH